ncbi:HPP family protein [Abyssogena phaseoliformis symbiont]|nr:HPP family protein [Abyssogena phaseoliformis symbiont]
MIADTLLATSIAIPLALVAMHFLKCMHPPGGATAVTAIIGGRQF